MSLVLQEIVGTSKGGFLAFSISVVSTCLPGTQNSLNNTQSRRRFRKVGRDRGKQRTKLTFSRISTMFTVSLILLIGIDACGHVHNCVKTAVVQSSETIHAWLQSSCPSGGKQKIFPNFLKSSERRSIFTVLFKTSSKFEMKPFFITFKDPTISSSFHFLV